MTYTTIVQNKIPQKFREQCTSSICPAYLPPKNSRGENRRNDIYPCIDIASLKMFLWETPKEKLIKRKGCNMILNRLQSRGHSPLNLASIKAIMYQSNQHFPSVKYGRDFLINLWNNRIFNLQGICSSNVSQHMRINHFVSNIENCIHITCLYPSNTSNLVSINKVSDHTDHSMKSDIHMLDFQIICENNH